MHFTWKMRARYLARGSFAVNLLMKLRAKKQRQAWENGGRFGPPHIIKQLMLQEHARKYSLTTLVETGTFLGDMVHAMKDNFNEIYSIELSEDLHKRAQSIFKKYPHIHLVAGDSAKILGSVLSGINDRCLFWLDGHYSAGITALGESRCPLYAEIEAILQHPVKGHVLLIDDAICFNGHDGYPTLFELHDIVVNRFPGYEMQVFDNAIQIRPTLQ
jgi:hypothetical protein